MIKYGISPCTECKPPKRCINCHSNCSDFITWKAERDKINDIRNEYVKQRRDSYYEKDKAFVKLLKKKKNGEKVKLH